ncbi:MULTISPECIES: class I SAM-dependent methyltransferase [Neobacillus]|jgi:SAM-dependent methyltransferase|uniref:Class I SAM-dependent methyltransferase n=1 Tax=Neobacillus sedimentimangrovi TaxID=2699460 RepID=A0ABS8QIX0_9BACI|nr:class I SAM-dependent methyltransferase [Neobacillus sedimentimangrovi]AIM15676.1 methyltransferase [Bacillus sp. X1(2014)]MCD4838559.1 class I SAM-dependent methyltransferase [Neobacillus sedimentimangrovi]
MSSYKQFAYLYDELMKDAPYDKWVQFVKRKLKKYQLNRQPLSLLDLACGTGELSVRFAKEGFQVTGVDLSADMLAVAQAKGEKNGFSIPFFQQNMAELEGLGLFDVVGIFCDSLNYLESEQEVRDTFAKVFQHLKPGGLFIFDVHSIYKITQVFMNETFALNEEKISYIWNSFPGEYSNCVEHELTFFVLDEGTGKYDRYDEFHVQRTFTVQQYSGWLTEAGFQVQEINADFEDSPPQQYSERIFFIARKE